MMTHTVRFAVFCGVACLLTASIVGGGFAAPGGRADVRSDDRIHYNSELTFEATLQSGSSNNLDNSERTHIFYDRGKFALQSYSKNAAGNFVLLATRLYDGSNTAPAIAWEYHPDTHEARPDMRSCDGAVSAAVRQMGEAAARRRYAIPAAYGRAGLRHMDGPQGIRDVLNQWRTLPSVSLTRGTGSMSGYTCRLVGNGRMVGCSCRIYETQYRMRPSPGGPPPYISESIKSWVEPKSRLVLREESRSFAPPASPMPPQYSVKEVTSIRFPAALSLSVFQLPPGTTALVPETMRNAVVPPGVRRAPATGNWAMTGVDLSEVR